MTKARKLIETFDSIDELKSFRVLFSFPNGKKIGDQWFEKFPSIGDIITRKNKQFKVMSLVDQLPTLKTGVAVPA
tara:strand:+ start:304 stop:528 length:225 start_codon:yes stop_codon:yes gene_type:complete